jgi:cytochrome P450
MSDFVIAGVESVTSSIRWTLLYLAVHQEYMIELRTELDNFLKDSTMAQLASYSSRHELPYLEAVISESLRISPAVPMIVHVNHEDFVGVENFIPKGTWVMGNIWAVHHDHKVFEHPDSFRPTRFLKPIHGGGVCFKKELMEKCCSFSVGKFHVRLLS